MEAPSSRVLCVISCFLVLSTAAAANGYIAINCGSSATSEAPNGREWLGEKRPKDFTIEGLSTSVTTENDLEQVPYSAARVSRSQFSYRFRLNPGEKLIRLHFSPAPYKEAFRDFFTVEAACFTLLYNFSASITARALAANVVVREFCLTVEENQPLDIVFTPNQSPVLGVETYAFVNGIEIHSLPSALSFFQGGGGTRIQIVGQKDVSVIDTNTALEFVRSQRVDRKPEPVPILIDDAGSSSWQKEGFKVEKSTTWKTFVDVGFRYLVRIHFSEFGLRIVENGEKDFSIVINGMIAATSTDVLRFREEEEEEGFLSYKNYMVVVNGQKKQGKREIVISIDSEDGISVIEGFEIFKVSNPDNSLAGPNPILPPVLSSPPFSVIPGLFLPILQRNAISSAFVILICLVNILADLLQRIFVYGFTEEVGENRPSARAKRLFRRFSFAEIQSATDDFSDALLIGKGGFGKVYKGNLDGGRETVAIKRLNTESKQGKREFWTEIEALCELRHLNLVSLIGYCKEKREMILVYEYIPCGSLADHLYDLARKNEVYLSLSWIQRLKICIGAARGLDYLHTGHGIIHRDIKASNILLDEHFLAKVSDFGLAKWQGGRLLESQESENIKGTFGYLDPNYYRTHQLTTKSDTYSFGVVLLEVLCGRPAVDAKAEEDKRNVTIWVQREIKKGEIDTIVDPSIKREILPNSLMTFLGITEKCLHDEPNKRPTIAHVVINLELALVYQEHGESVAPDEIENDLLFNGGRSTLRSTAAYSRALFPKTAQLKSKMILDGKKHGGKTGMHKLARLLQLDSVWNTIKSSKKNETVPLSAMHISTAPISRRTGKVANGGNLLGKRMDKSRELMPIPGVKIFSFTELKAATQDFSTVLGIGGYGTVYKGWLKESLGANIGNEFPIAVKVSNPNSELGIEQWKSEVTYLGRLSHPNVIKLLGYCSKKMNLLTVYEFMGGGNLHDQLFNRSCLPLPFDVRLRILVGVARGLAYLHSRQVIWRDVKGANILLDEKYNPKISDFGLAKSGPVDASSHVTTRLIGTLGYIAPEYMASGYLSTKADVYGFGVVMLEMMSGSRALDNQRPHGQQDLVACTMRLALNERKVKKLMDVRLQGNYSPSAALKLAALATLCLSSEPKHRPSMQQVVQALERISSVSAPGLSI